MDAGYDPNESYLPHEERKNAYTPYEQVPQTAMPPIPPPHYQYTQMMGTEAPKWDTHKMFGYFGMGMAVLLVGIIIVVLLKRKGNK